jgi:hypothetical protein
MSGVHTRAVFNDWPGCHTTGEHQAEPQSHPSRADEMVDPPFQTLCRNSRGAGRGSMSLLDRSAGGAGIIVATALLSPRIMWRAALVTLRFDLTPLGQIIESPASERPVLQGAFEPAHPRALMGGGAE